MLVRKLLIADVDVSLVENLAAFFRARGIEVKTAYDGLGVLKSMHVAVPDAVCMAADLRCDNGLSVCELLAAERRFHELPIVLFIEHADDWLAHDCRDLQAYYVAKGPELARRIQLLVDEARSHAPLLAVD